jgi:hypothetical protein
MYFYILITKSKRNHIDRSGADGRTSHGGRVHVRVVVAVVAVVVVGGGGRRRGGGGRWKDSRLVVINENHLDYYY